MVRVDAGAEGRARAVLTAAGSGVGELRVLVCVKRVPAPGARIVLTADRLAVDATNLGFTISPHEECAVEEALRITEQHGGDATVLTLGPPASDEQLRYSLSLGVQHAVRLAHERLSDIRDWDPQATARALTDGIAELEAEAGRPFDLVLFGNESADAGGFQVGIRVARALGRPVVNGIKGIVVDGEAVTARREGRGGLEIYRLDLPAVLGVMEGINLPRYPTVPGRLRSTKADIQVLDATLARGGAVLCALENAPDVEVQTSVLGHGPGAAPAVVDVLESLGLL